MATLTEIVATVVVHSSAAALSHFGVTLQPAPMPACRCQPAPVERVVARSPQTREKVDNGADRRAHTHTLRA